MSEPLRDEVRQWLRKADHDLGSARKLATGPKPYFDTAIYHCQQAAEETEMGSNLHCGTLFPPLPPVQIHKETKG